MAWTLGVGAVLAVLATLSMWRLDSGGDAREAADALRWTAGLGLAFLAGAALWAGAPSGAALAAAAAAPMLAGGVLRVRAARRRPRLRVLPAPIPGVRPAGDRPVDRRAA